MPDSPYAIALTHIRRPSDETDTYVKCVDINQDAPVTETSPSIDATLRLNSSRTTVPVLLDMNQTQSVFSSIILTQYNWFIWSEGIVHIRLGHDQRTAICGGDNRRLFFALSCLFHRYLSVILCCHHFVLFVRPFACILWLSSDVRSTQSRYRRSFFVSRNLRPHRHHRVWSLFLTLSCAPIDIWYSHDQLFSDCNCWCTVTLSLPIVFVLAYAAYNLLSFLLHRWLRSAFVLQPDLHCCSFLQFFMTKFMFIV